MSQLWQMARRYLAVAAVLLALAAARPGWADEGERLVVGAGGQYGSLHEALAAAMPGDLIEVRGGSYPGPLVVDKSVTLQGVGWPVIDGGGQGTVVTLAVPGVVFRGFEVRGSGIYHDQDNSGIVLLAPDIVVEDNRLVDVLFGIYGARSDRAIISGNDITSKADHEMGRKGDGIRLWYSADVLVAANRLHQARDVVIWYSSGVTLRDNLIEAGRFGIHLMYSDHALIENNQLIDNSVGIYAMYSDSVVLRDNLLRGQRGPSGYGLGFKDCDDITATGNVIVDNRVGAFFDSTPFSPQGTALISDNLFVFNDAGITLLPAVRGAVFEANTFWENGEQMTLQGGGTPGANIWYGNYWSDYAGFDADGDGQGDMPYRSQRYFESLTDREPRLRALLHSPAVQAIELAAAAFPIVQPKPKLEDPAPRMQPHAVPGFALPEPGPAAGLWLAGAGLLALAAGCVALGRMSGTGQSPASRGVTRQLEGNDISGGEAQPGAVGGQEGQQAMLIEVRELTKRYGKLKALDNVSFEASAGQAIALWGANGAGKTTLLRALLGLLHFEGDVAIAGRAVRKAPKAARRLVGYVPQESAFYDLTVKAAMDFYGRLKRVGPERIHEVLQQLGLSEHAHKPVPALSGGLKQRLALALALLADPPVLLLDEPTANLDAAAQRDYLRLLARLRKEHGKLIIFASHRLEEVVDLADRVLVLEQGRLVDSVTPLELVTGLMPEIDLTLWVPEARRPEAVACLEAQGWPTHLNGRGTVVVRVRPEHKMQPLQALNAHGIGVENFAMEAAQPWN
jgi:nitrous oxidase accessory protein